MYILVCMFVGSLAGQEWPNARPLGPFVAPDQYLMAPDSSCAMHDIAYSSYYYLKWMDEALIILYTVYEMELQLLIVEK